MTRSSRSVRTTTAPTWPSDVGTTANNAGVGAEAQPAARAASARSARNFKGTLFGFLVDLDHELGAAHAHDRGRRADLHRFRRLLHHLAGNRGEAPLL